MFTVKCPQCDARYELDETKIGPTGRKLKCAKCSHIWVAFTPVKEIQVVEEMNVYDRAFGSEPIVEDDHDRIEKLALVARNPIIHWIRGGRLWLLGASILCFLGALGGGYILWQKRGLQHSENKNILIGGESSLQPSVARSLVLRNIVSEFFEVSGTVDLQFKGNVLNISADDVILPILNIELLDEHNIVFDVVPVEWSSEKLSKESEMAWKARFEDVDVTKIVGWRALFK